MEELEGAGELNVIQWSTHEKNKSTDPKIPKCTNRLSANIPRTVSSQLRMRPRGLKDKWLGGIKSCNPTEKHKQPQNLEDSEAQQESQPPQPNKSSVYINVPQYKSLKKTPQALVDNSIRNSPTSEHNKGSENTAPCLINRKKWEIRHGVPKQLS